MIDVLFDDYAVCNLFDAEPDDAKTTMVIPNAFERVNKDVLKSFKNLQGGSPYLYTSAINEYLTCIHDKAMIVYDNPDEIDFEGTYKLSRNKLIPANDKNLLTSPEAAIDLRHFTFMDEFGMNLLDLQRFCYDNNLRINTASLSTIIEQLLHIYKAFKLYRSTDREEIMMVFNNDKHKTYLLSKLI